MDALAPLPVAVPLVAAAALVAASPLARRRIPEVLAIATASAVAVLCAVLVARSSEGLVVHWVGGWTPREGVALGISLAIDPLGAALAGLAAVLTAAACVYSGRSVEARGPFFQALMLVFLAGMTGFCLTGDLFDMFVFFELMSVAAFALTGFRTEEPAPLAGAVNFAVTNAVGASLLLTGIALLYGRTGALNLAQVGDALAAAPADGLVIVAFVLIAVGFLVKAAIVPFHFWLADAYAVAPIAACVLFSGAMSELGLYGLLRVYATVFSGPFGEHVEALRGVLVAAGVLTALVGAVMALAQRHLKRLLAFVTVSHLGLFLVGGGLLTPEGLAGAAIFILADGLVKAALFLGVGVLGHRRGTVDEAALHGRGPGLGPTGVMVAAGGLALASLPASGPFLGKALIEEAAGHVGLAWVGAVFVVVSAMTGGAVLRAAGRIWLGWGRPADVGGEAVGDERDPEHVEARRRRPGLVLGPAIALLAAGLAVGVVPGLAAASHEAAARFLDRPGYAAALLARPPAPGPSPAAEAPAEVGPKPLDFGLAGVTVILALAVGAAPLLSDRRPRLAGRAAVPALRRGLAGLRALHSGHVGDYVAWLVVGAAALGAAFAGLLG